MIKAPAPVRDSEAARLKYAACGLLLRAYSSVAAFSSCLAVKGYVGMIAEAGIESMIAKLPFYPADNGYQTPMTIANSQSWYGLRQRPD